MNPPSPKPGVYPFWFWNGVQEESQIAEQLADHEPPAGPDRPMGSLIEEVLSPLDRDEFRREITYFSDLSSQSADRTSPGAPQP